MGAAAVAAAAAAAVAAVAAAVEVAVVAVAVVMMAAAAPLRRLEHYCRGEVVVAGSEPTAVPLAAAPAAGVSDGRGPRSRPRGG